jgi:hypothetical protein
MLRVRDERPVVSRARLGAVAGYLLLPELAVFVLIDIATSWWVAGLIAAGTLGAVVLAVAATRNELHGTRLRHGRVRPIRLHAMDSSARSSAFH